MSPDQLASLRDALNQGHHWPCAYTFKFIVPLLKLPEVLTLFPDVEPVTRPSAQGRYVGVTYTVDMDSSDDVIAAYGRATAVEGLIAL